MLKYKLIKSLDIAGLKVFEPLVRLAYWDEPRVQVKNITLFILVPTFAFFLFLACWGYIAPRHTTKSGEVPTPSVVMDAWEGILTFHEREHQKMSDFKMKGAAREAAYNEVIEELKIVEEDILASSNKLTTLIEKEEELIAEKLAPIKVSYDEKRNKFKVAQKNRSNVLKAMAEHIGENDTDEKLKLIQSIKDNQELKDGEKKQLQVIKNEMNAARGYVHQPTKEEKAKNSLLEAKKQYLLKRCDLLSEDNKVVKLKKANEDLELKNKTYLESSGVSLLSQANSLVRGEKSVTRISESNYAKPWTFIDQIVRSLGCVFLGFVIATVIAIPMGILCGLSPVFMASMVPLISLFKPVSPIVWLPIIFIIVGGFVDNPDEAILHPAFLSSAITVALCSLWPTLVNTALGVASIEKDYLNVAKVLKLGFWNRLFKIVIPSALPLIFAGLRISLGVGWMVLIAAELLSSSEGIGKFVWDMFNNGSSETFAQMFVVVFVVGIVGLMLDRVMIILQRLVSFDDNATGI